jgi:hypothetical protein
MSSGEAYRGTVTTDYTQPPSTLKSCALHIALSSATRNSALLAMSFGVLLK